MNIVYYFIENEASTVFFTSMQVEEDRDHQLEQKASIKIISAWDNTMDIK